MLTTAFDAMPDGDPWGPMCRSCKRPIGKNEPMKEVRFEVDPERRLEDLNGPATPHAPGHL